VVGNSNDPQELPVIDDAFHDEVLRGLERDDVPMRVRSRLQGARNGTLPWSATLAPVDLRAGDTPLTCHAPDHESYGSNESEGAV
jgi:hypothetical protein